MEATPRRRGSSSASGWCGGACGAARCSRTCSRRCSSSPRWASGSATSSTSTRAASRASTTSSSSRPGLMAASAVMQAAGESLWPVMGGVKWMRHVPRRGVDADQLERRLPRAALVDRCAHGDVGDGVPRRSPRCSAACRRSGACSRSRRRCSARSRSRRRCRRGRSSGRATPRSPSSCASWCSRCSCSRGRSSRSAVSRTGSSRWRCCRRCTTRVELCRTRPPASSTAGPRSSAHVVVLCVFIGVGRVVGPAHVQPEADAVTADRRRRRGGDAAAAGRAVDARLIPGGDRARRAARRRAQHDVPTGASGICSSPGCIEPLLYLLSIGIGVGGLVGKVPGPGGELIDYKTFVAPGPDGGGGDERRGARHHVQLLLQVQVRAHVRRHARDAARRARRRVRRDDVGAAARRALLGRVPRDDGGRRAGALVVGAARGAGRAAHRLPRSPARASAARRSCGRGSTSTT